MAKPAKPICPLCFKGYLERREKLVTSTYRGQTITYKQPGEWCDRCDEGILSGKDALATQPELLKWRAQVDKREHVKSREHGAADPNGGP